MLRTMSEMTGYVILAVSNDNNKVFLYGESMLELFICLPYSGSKLLVRLFFSYSY